MNNQSKSRILGIILLAWLAVIGFDFVLHASLLAPLYAEPDPFLLPPLRAFTLIPLGYLSFLILVILLVWLMTRLQIATWKNGFVFGLKLGSLLWGALVLSLLSITPAPALLMLAWFVGQTIELGIAGLVAGAGFGASGLKKLVLWVILFFLVCFVTGIILQNL